MTLQESGFPDGPSAVGRRHQVAVAVVLDAPEPRRRAPAPRCSAAPPAARPTGRPARGPTGRGGAVSAVPMPARRASGQHVQPRQVQVVADERRPGPRPRRRPAPKAVRERGAGMAARVEHHRCVGCGLRAAAPRRHQAASGRSGSRTGVGRGCRAGSTLRDQHRDLGARPGAPASSTQPAPLTARSHGEPDRHVHTRADRRARRRTRAPRPGRRQRPDPGRRRPAPSSPGR